MDKKKRIESFKNGLIVSCQTAEGDPIHGDGISTVVMMAKASEWAGAVAIRANSIEQIKAIRKEVSLPIIGLQKTLYDGAKDITDVIITPTVEIAKEIWEAGAEIIAVDCTMEKTPFGTYRYEVLPKIKEALPDAIILADVDTCEAAVNAAKLGADMVAPTCYGYSKSTRHLPVPNYREIAKMCRELEGICPVIMEGHTYTPEDAIKALHLGCHAVVVGSAITRPHLIAKRFIDLMGGLQDDWRNAETAIHKDK